MAIEHVLHAHSRAITDINWHTTDPNQVVSTGIDGWLWGWDIRRTNKPVLGEVIAIQSEFLADHGCRVVCIQRCEEPPEEST